MTQDKDVIRVKISFLHFLPQMFVIAASILLFVYGLTHWPWSYQWVKIKDTQFPLSIFGLPAVYCLVGILARKYNEKLVITPEYVLFIQGIFSWKQDTIRMDYEAIKEVAISQTIIQRILGIGNLSCLTAATALHSEQATLPGVRDPRKFKGIIMDRMRPVHSGR